MLTDFFEKMKSLFNEDEFEMFKNSFSCPPKRGLVVNNRKIDLNDFLKNNKLDISPLPYDKNCFLLNSSEKVGHLPIHHAGAIYMQEPSAMLAGLLLPVKDGDMVLDACASPGGKTFQVARRKNCCLFSNEIEYSRAKVLESNVERLGLNNVIVTNFTSEELGEKYENTFDAVLVDAPCSGEGMFRREQQAITQWSQDYVNLCAKRQIEIVKNLDAVLKTNGYLMYSTCTFSIEENEEVVKQIVDLGYEIVDLGEIEGAQAGIKLDGYNTHLAKRFYPHSSFGEGQFVCLLKKTKLNICKSKQYKYVIKELGNKEFNVFKDFIEENLNEGWLNRFNNLCVRNENVYYCPNKSLISDDKKTITFGVKLGEINKGYFKPSHNFFTAFGDYFKRKIELSEELVNKYLKGETFNFSVDNGWCCIKYLGATLGGGKAVNGLIKNHYPKGLRNI